MNWIDIILALVIILSMTAGWYRGFIIGMLALLSWTGSLVAGYLFYPYIADGLSVLIESGPWLIPVSFIITCVMARILIGLVARQIVRILPERANQHSVNRFFGIIPGVVNGWVYAVIISALIWALPLKNSLIEETRKSRVAGQLATQAEWANRKLAPLFDDAIRQTLNSLGAEPETGETVDLSFRYDNAVDRPLLEAAMLQLVNGERVKRGLKPLKADPELKLVARAHSQDMFVRGYFAHTNPDGKNPFDRMRDAHIRFLAAGENLALARTVEIAHRNLMNSPGHRANILNPAFGRLGIGILDGGFHGLMISQEFRE